MTHLPLDISPAVQTALDAHRPVVALESTIITHGMPWPQNLETAQAIESTIRDNKAEPATIAVIDGRLCVGLSAEQLETLAQAKHVAKLSRADMAVCMAKGGTGATTVAATMIAAHLAGIKVLPPGASAVCIAARIKALTSPPIFRNWHIPP